MEKIIYSILIIFVSSFSLNANKLEYSNSTNIFDEPKPSYVQIYSHVDKISKSLFSSKPECTLYIYSNLNGERWIKCEEPNLVGLRTDCKSLTIKLSGVILEMMLGFSNHKRNYPISLKQYFEILNSYGIKGFEWKTKEYSFVYTFEEVLNN